MAHHLVQVVIHLKSLVDARGRRGKANVAKSRLLVRTSVTFMDHETELPK